MRLLATVVLSGLLAACGFKLRGTQQLPFETVFVAAPANSQLAVELVRSIGASTRTRVVDDRPQAQAVVEITAEGRERDVLSVNAQGRAREFTLRLRVTIRVHDDRGRDYIGRTPLAASRDLAVTEAELLARGAEETQLYRDMQTDLVQQILRRLSAVKS